MTEPMENRRKRQPGFIVELTTMEGQFTESYSSYEEAQRRVEYFPADNLVSLPLIFQELPDGSQRLVRLDGKPLQWHRLPEDPLPGPEEPIPLCEQSPEVPSGTQVTAVPLLDPEDGDRA